MNLGRYITRNAVYYPDNTALRYSGRSMSYRELENRTNRLAQGLMSLGLGRGDRVAIQAWNRPEIVEFEVSCYKAGIVRIPINARLSETETLHVLNDSLATAVISDAPHGDSLIKNSRQLQSVKHFIGLGQPHGGEIPYEHLLAESSDDSPNIDVNENDLAVLAYTSGSTGKLKAIMQSYGNRMAMIRKACMMPGIKIEPGDVFAHIGPLTHSSGMLLMPVMYFAGCNLILHRFNVEALLEAIAQEKVNYMLLVPAMINMILSHPRVSEFDLSSLKGVFYGAAPMSVTRIRQSMDLFGPILIQGYGMSETTSFTSILTAQDHASALSGGDETGLASCGRPVFESEVRVIDGQGNDVSLGQIGEIIVRGPDVMKGYYNEPDLTRETIVDGWIHSGDMAKVDKNGYIYIVDRKSDTIITGGFNVYPTEVEQVLYSHPAVYEACVVGVPDEKWGEAVKAVVILKQGSTISEEDLIDYCRQSLGSYKKPRSIDFVDELPKNPSGKIARRAVKEKYWSHKQRRVN